MITEAVRGNGAILINRKAQRFVNEITTRDKAAAAILAQEGGSAFLIFDDSVRKSLKKIEGYIHLHFVVEGQSVAELAQKLEVSAPELEKTLATYNQYQNAGKDEQFKRPNLPRALNSLPIMPLKSPRPFTTPWVA